MISTVDGRETKFLQGLSLPREGEMSKQYFTVLYFCAVLLYTLMHACVDTVLFSLMFLFCTYPVQLFCPCGNRCLVVGRPGRTYVCVSVHLSLMHIQYYSCFCYCSVSFCAALLPQRDRVSELGRPDLRRQR